MKFIDLAKQSDRIRNKVDRRIREVLQHGRYIMGPEVRELEAQLTAYVGVKHCVSCSSGTDALLMSLLAWGIGPGDAVFTSPFTFIATAEVISLVGGTPVFVDIDLTTYNLDPALLDATIQRVVDEGQLRAAAVIPVDLFGLPADYGSIEPIAEKHQLLVLEDGAQSFGGAINGKKACSFGHAGATSFFPAKPLGCFGNGGALFTDDDELADRLVSIRVHGKGENKYDNVRVGINGRLDTIQAAILIEKLAIFPEGIILRDKVAARYTELLNGKVVTPTVPDGLSSSWAQYSVLAESAEHRDELRNRLKAEDIPTAVYYSKPLHLQPVFAHLGCKPGDFPEAELASQRIFSLPMHPYLMDDDVERIAGCF